MIRRRAFRPRWLLPAGALLALAGCAAGPGGLDPELPRAAPAEEASPESPGPRMAASLAGEEFGQAVRFAVQAHPSLAAGGARIAALEAELEGERSVRRPQVSLGADTGVQLVGPGRGRTTPLLQVRQLVFDGGAARARTEAARARVLRGASDRIGIAAELARSAVEAQFVLRHERRLVALAERNLEIHQEFLAQVEDRLDAGAGTEVDLLTARSRLADATARAVGARSRLERAEAAWRELYGTAPPAAVAPRAAPGLPAGSADALVRASPRLRSLEAEIAAARAARAAAEAARLPSVSLGVTGSRRPGGGTSVAGELGLRYDLATGGQREAAVRVAAARIDELEAERRDLSRQILRALEDVRSDQRTGQERLASAQAAREANEAAVESAREQFGVGRRNITQLLDAQRDFVGAAEAEAVAELDLALSGYAALALTGDILDVFGIELSDESGAGDQG